MFSALTVDCFANNLHSLQQEVGTVLADRAVGLTETALIDVHFRDLGLLLRDLSENASKADKIQDALEDLARALTTARALAPAGAEALSEIKAGDEALQSLYGVLGIIIPS